VGQPAGVAGLVWALLVAVMIGGCGDDPRGTQRVTFSIDRSLELLLLDLVVVRSASMPVGVESGPAAGLDSTSLPEAHCRASGLNGGASFFTRSGQWRGVFSGVLGLSPGGGPDSSIADLFSCTFYADRFFSADDFEIIVADAIGLDHTRLETFPEVSVSGIEQIGPIRTTTTEFGAGGALVYDLTASVISDSGRLGALQFDINPRSIAGRWVGSAGTVNCSFNVAVGLSVCNDKGGGLLSCALVDLSGFDTSGSIVTCQLAASTQPSPDDFLVVVQDTADVNSQKVSVEMAITDLRLR